MESECFGSRQKVELPLFDYHIYKLVCACLVRWVTCTVTECLLLFDTIKITYSSPSVIWTQVIQIPGLPDSLMPAVTSSFPPGDPDNDQMTRVKSETVCTVRLVV